MIEPVEMRFRMWWRRMVKRGALGFARKGGDGDGVAG
jgi:hypothetical protein